MVRVIRRRAHTLSAEKVGAAEHIAVEIAPAPMSRPSSEEEPIHAFRASRSLPGLSSLAVGNLAAADRAPATGQGLVRPSMRSHGNRRSFNRQQKKRQSFGSPLISQDFQKDQEAASKAAAATADQRTLVAHRSADSFEAEEGHSGSGGQDSATAAGWQLTALLCCLYAVVCCGFVALFTAQGFGVELTVKLYELKPVLATPLAGTTTFVGTVLYILDVSFWKSTRLRGGCLSVVGVLALCFLALDSLPYMHFALFLSAAPMVMYAAGTALVGSQPDDSFVKHDVEGAGHGPDSEGGVGAGRSRSSGPIVVARMGMVCIIGGGIALGSFIALDWSHERSQVTFAALAFWCNACAEGLRIHAHMHVHDQVRSTERSHIVYATAAMGPGHAGCDRRAARSRHPPAPRSLHLAPPQKHHRECSC